MFLTYNVTICFFSHIAPWEKSAFIVPPVAVQTKSCQCKLNEGTR